MTRCWTLTERLFHCKPASQGKWRALAGLANSTSPLVRALNAEYRRRLVLRSNYGRWPQNIVTFVVRPIGIDCLFNDFFELFDQRRPFFCYCAGKSM